MQFFNILIFVVAVIGVGKYITFIHPREYSFCVCQGIYRISQIVTWSLYYIFYEDTIKLKHWFQIHVWMICVHRFELYSSSHVCNTMSNVYILGFSSSFKCVFQPWSKAMLLKDHDQEQSALKWVFYFVILIYKILTYLTMNGFLFRLNTWHGGDFHEYI